MKERFQAPDSGVRLDKLAHATIEWEEDFLVDMVNRRLSFYSDGEVCSLADVYERAEKADAKTRWLARLAGRSPRELIRLFDTIFREHDRRFSGSATRVPLNDDSLENGADIYVKDVCEGHYDARAIAQVVRLGVVTFTNRDVQRTFRINDASARNRIRSWEESGMVQLSGTRAAEGGQGGKPQNEYSVVDLRVARIIERGLVAADFTEDDADLDEQDTQPD